MINHGEWALRKRQVLVSAPKSYARSTDAATPANPHEFSRLEVARIFSNNHTGFVFFDEPQQQNVKDLSFSALLRRAYLAKKFNQQVVVSISKLPLDFTTIIPENDRHLIDINDKWMLIPE